MDQNVSAKNNGRGSHTNQLWWWWWTVSFIYSSMRPTFRAATTTRRNLLHWRTQRTGLVAAQRSWVAPGLRRFIVVAVVVCCIFDHCILLVICQTTSTYLVPLLVVSVGRRRSAYYKWDCQWCCCCILDHCILLILCQITSTTWCHLWCLFADGGQRIISRIDFYCHCLVAIV